MAATVRVCAYIKGLPEDGLFLELDTAGSEVVWADGSLGSVRQLWSQSSGTEIWSLDVLTTVPPSLPDIRSIRVSLDLHRPTRVARSEAVIAADEAASFDFGVLRARWILSADLGVTEFMAGAYGKPVVPFLDRGLYAQELVRLTDSNGNVLQRGGGGSAGSQTITHWGSAASAVLVPPVHVIVDVPQETVKSRVLICLKDIRTRR